MDSNVSNDKSATQFVDKLLSENDLKGAIDFAKRMQNSFPKLKRLWHFLANIVVQVFGEYEEADLYTVLGVDPAADPYTIKKHYVQLAEGSGLGSREAHKLLNKAWDTLSGRFTRRDYDLRRRFSEMQQKALAVKQASSANETVSQAFSDVNKATEVPSLELSPRPFPQGSYTPPPSYTFPSNRTNIQPVIDNVSGKYGSGQMLDSAATEPIQPAPVLYNVSGNRSCLRIVSSAKQSIFPPPRLYNVSRNQGNDLTSASSATPLIQPASDTCNVSGNYGSGPTLVSSDTTFILPAPGIYNVSGNNKYGVSPSATHLIQSSPGLHNVMGISGSALRSVSSATRMIQPAPDLYNGTVSSATQLNQPAPVNLKRHYEGGDQTGATRVKSPCVYLTESGSSLPLSGSIGNKYGVSPSATHLIQLSPGLHNVMGISGSALRSVSSATRMIQPAPDLYNGTVSSAAQLNQPAPVNLKRRYEGGDQTGATRVKSPCVYFTESGSSLPLSGSIGNTDNKHKERMSPVVDICDGSKNVPEKHIPPGSDGQKGCQTADSQAEQVGAYRSRKENCKKLSDLEKDSLKNMARNVILNKLNECAAAASDNNEGSSADNIENSAIKGPEEDGLKVMEVPDPDFHNFDKDRNQKSFAESQVWAVYDEDDGMPRLYALIRKVSKRPFKLQLSWLNSRSNMEPGSIKWIDSGFHQTCGDFFVGKEKISIGLNSFSHRVTGCTKAARVFQIFPKKGDVWALYRNWSPDWNEHTTEEEKHKYDMVEVLEDYNEQVGVTIVSMMKVDGFKAVFCQHSDAKEVRTVPKEEIFRFSHQVSSYLLTDEEAPNVPKGSKELDPAALPLELLQVRQ